MIFKHGIDQFAQASAEQGEQVRRVAYEATLSALQRCELTLTNIRLMLSTFTEATSVCAAYSTLPAFDVEGLIGKVFADMDGTLEQAVLANLRVLQQLVEQGVSLHEVQLKRELLGLGKMEGTLFRACSRRDRSTACGLVSWRKCRASTPALVRALLQHLSTSRKMQARAAVMAAPAWVDE